MQRALLYARHPRQHIPEFIRRTWSQIIHQQGTLRLFYEATRCASSFTFTPRLSSQRQAGAGAEGVTLDEDLTVPEAMKRAFAQVMARKRQSTKADTTAVEHPPPGSTRYGKWQILSLDEDRLLHELGIGTVYPHTVRHIDHISNENDMELWACLLDFSHRRTGRKGVLRVWEAVSKRRTLYLVVGPLAQDFWSTVLKAAISRNTIHLKEVVIYAEWMLQTHNARWPQLYSTIMSYMLENGSKSEVLQWHATLNPSFGPGEAEFAELMMKAMASTTGWSWRNLEMLYTHSMHRKLYDILIPHLYSKGCTKLAMRWRQTFRAVNDTPVSLAARPFLRFVGAYYPLTRLEDDELKVAGLVRNQAEEAESTSELPGMAIKGQDLSYLINRVHGETFGIQEKPYNDHLGARWFASSWVSLEFAINVIYTMGIQEIGPLSLQSIALREGSARGMLSRLDQLRQLKINLPKSHYVEAIRHYSVIGDDEALHELLKSDVHPDVFDDETAIHELLQGCVRVGDWATYRLVLSTRLAASSSDINASSDSVLQAFAHQGNGLMVLPVLREMASHGFDLAPETSHILSGLIVQNLSKHADSAEPRRHVDLHISLCRHLARSRFPPAVEAWQTLLNRVGREQRLLELERLCFYIVQLFTDYSTSEQPMWNAHMADVPEILRCESPFPNFQKLPRDLNIRHEQHPLRQIFDKKLQNNIVRWGFAYTRYDRKAEAAAAAVINSTTTKKEQGSDDQEAGDPRTPADFHFARGIRLLAMLRDRGLFILPNKVSKQAHLRLMDLYRGEGRPSYKWGRGNMAKTQMRRKNRLSLAEAKVLCDEAWGAGEIVPSHFELSRSMQMTAYNDSLDSIKKRLESVHRRQ